jgi:AcrR family transcriptional regulator
LLAPRREQGYKGTTVTEIVERAKVSRASFYAVLSDRDDSFTALISRAGDVLLAWLSQNEACASVVLFDAPAGPPEARLVLANQMDHAPSLAADLNSLMSSPYAAREGRSL